MGTRRGATFLFALVGCGPATQVVHVPFPAPDATTLVVVQGPLDAPTKISAFERGGPQPDPIILEESLDREVRVVAYEAAIFDLGLVSFDAEPLPSDMLGQLPDFGRTYLLTGEGEGEAAAWREVTEPGRPLPAVRVPRRASPTEAFSLRIIDFEMSVPVAGVELCVENAVPPQCATSGPGGLVEMSSVGVQDDLVFIARDPNGDFYYPPHIFTFSVRRTGGHVGSVYMLSRAERGRIASAAEITLNDQTEGSLAFVAFSPGNTPLPGVRIELEVARRVVYFENGVVEPDRTETDPSGVGGVLGVPPGEIEARFVHRLARCERNPNGWRSSSPEITRSLVRSGHFTLLLPVYCE